MKRLTKTPISRAAKFVPQAWEEWTESPDCREPGPLSSLIAGQNWAGDLDETADNPDSAEDEPEPPSPQRDRPL